MKAERRAWVTLRVQFDDEEGACFVVLGLGPVVDVIEPASLHAARAQAAVAATVERMHESKSPTSEPVRSGWLGVRDDFRNWFVGIAG